MSLFQPTETLPVSDSPPLPTSARPGQAPRSELIIAFATNNIGLLALLLLLLVAAIAAPSFYRISQLQTMGAEAAIVGIVTIGQVFALLIRGLDVSVNSVAAVMAFAIVSLSGGSSGTRLFLALLIGFASAVAVGCLNATAVMLGHIPPFVATYATLFIVQGASLIIFGGQVSGTVPAAVTALGQGLAGPLPIGVLVWIAMAGIGSTILRYSAFGRAIYATGANISAARLSGIRVAETTILVYIFCAVCAAIAGVLLAGNLGYVDQSIGQSSNVNLLSLAAAVIGGVAFSGGKGGLLNPFCAVLFVIGIANIVVILGLPVQFQTIAQGASLVIAISLQRLVQRRDPRLEGPI